MGNFGESNDPELQVYLSLLLISCTIGIVSSLLNIVIILKMGPMTSHIYLVFVMTSYQLIYNAAFFIKDGSTDYYTQHIANFFTIFCGISTSLISNWISFAMFSTVINRKKFDVTTNLPILHLSYFIPACVLCILYLKAVFPKDDGDVLLEFIVVKYLNNFIRFGSILLNFILILATTLHIYNLYGKTGHRSAADVAVSALCRRMVFYPIIQAIGRSGAAWYEIEYNLNYEPMHPSPERFSSLLFMAIISPLVSLGYLLVFLWMQPNAWNRLKSAFGYQSVIVEREKCGQHSFSVDDPVNSVSSHAGVRRIFSASNVDDVALESILEIGDMLPSLSTYSNITQSFSVRGSTNATSETEMRSTSMINKTTLTGLSSESSMNTSDVHNSVSQDTENPMLSVSSSSII